MMKVQRLNRDIISTLPQNIIESILTLIPIREAVRTSVLSRKWRFCWTSMPKLVFDDKLVEVPSDCQKLKKSKLANAIFHVLLLHTGSILEFKFDVGELDMDSEFDQIIRYLSRSNNLKKMVIEISGGYYYHNFYKLPTSFFSLQGLEILQLTKCDVEPPLTFNGFSRLNSVYFHNVKITSKILQHFLSNCPLLTEVILDGCGDEEDFERGSKFTFVELLKSVPLIEVLVISEFYMQYLIVGGMSLKLPISVHLLYLNFVVCLTEQDMISSALCLMRSSPNLQKITFMLKKKSDAPQISMKLIDFQDYLDFKLDHLEELEMLYFNNVGLELEFVKLIMAKSPVLKEVRIELNKDVSVDEELKILRNLVQLAFPRASPSAILTIERPRASS